MKTLIKRTLITFAVVTGIVAFEVIAEGWHAFGASAQGTRLERLQKSPQWRDGKFENPQPLINHVTGTLVGLWHASKFGRPSEPLVPQPVNPEMFLKPPSSGLRITWLGHGTSLIELDGTRVLTDPVWSERPSPVSWAGPTRWYPPPISLAQLPALDAVLISHDHYDHLDMETIKALNQKGVSFRVPLGVGAHLEKWGVSPERIHEFDWWETLPLDKEGTVRTVATPARHASGRQVFDKDATLWSGWAVVGPTHRVYYSGDTGLFPAMKDIGERLGPFDVTLIESGQYHSAWPDWHIGPEQAVQAHQWVKGRVMMPVHWALLTLAYHGWTEPVERVIAQAKTAGVRVVTPRPGQSVEPEVDREPERWWPNVPWESAAEHPIVSSGVN